MASNSVLAKHTNDELDQQDHHIAESGHPRDLIRFRASRSVFEHYFPALQFTDLKALYSGEDAHSRRNVVRQGIWRGREVVAKVFCTSVPTREFEMLDSWHTANLPCLVPIDHGEVFVDTSTGKQCVQWLVTQYRELVPFIDPLTMDTFSGRLEATRSIAHEMRRFYESNVRLDDGGTWMERFPSLLESADTALTAYGWHQPKGLHSALEERSKGGALIHGDLHRGNIFRQRDIPPPNGFIVGDPEGGIVGNPAADMGYLIGATLQLHDNIDPFLSAVMDGNPDLSRADLALFTAARIVADATSRAELQHNAADIRFLVQSANSLMRTAELNVDTPGRFY